MTAKYLLPCSCGKKLQVRARQAGQMVRCSCGQQLEVPTMRGLANLSHADEADEEAPLWTLRQSIIFLGIVVALCAVAFNFYLFVNLERLKPDSGPRYDDILSEINTMSPARTWEEWHMRSAGLRLLATSESIATVNALESTYNWMLRAAVLGGLGLLAAAIAWWQRPSGHRKK